jgi:uncharacterized protein YprB with RNaseH-like and TPR domain
MGNNQFTKPWTKEERKILERKYPLLGCKVMQFLPNRTYDAINKEVVRLGIHFGLFGEGEEAYLDIETTNLNADFAYMLTYAFKVKGQDKVYSGMITKEEIFNGIFDKRLVKDFVNDLMKFKRVYGYYSTPFDIPFSRTRALYWKIPFPSYGLIQHQDLYYLVRNKLKFSRNRLENACEFLGIDGKTKLSGRIWVRAAIGDKKALDYILKHNIADVRILEKLHERIKEYADVQKRSL